MLTPFTTEEKALLEAEDYSPEDKEELCWMRRRSVPRECGCCSESEFYIVTKVGEEFFGTYRPWSGSDENTANTDLQQLLDRL